MSHSVSGLSKWQRPLVSVNHTVCCLSKWQCTLGNAKVTKRFWSWAWLLVISRVVFPTTTTSTTTTELLHFTLIHFTSISYSLHRDTCRSSKHNNTLLTYTAPHTTCMPYMQPRSEIIRNTTLPQCQMIHSTIYHTLQHYTPQCHYSQRRERWYTTPHTTTLHTTLTLQPWKWDDTQHQLLHTTTLHTTVSVQP